MKDKNLPNDIQSKSVEELTDLAINVIENLENKKNLEHYEKIKEEIIQKENIKKDNAENIVKNLKQIKYNTIYSMFIRY